ncbi:MAG: hypothetical protein WBQ44_18925 [Rhodococcus sp. (in: high G+C Gram-positive bacteria)]
METPTPVWKAAATVIVGAFLGGLSAVVRDGAWWAIALGLVVLCAGSVLAVQAVQRICRENTGRRIPWFGRPPVSPRRFDLKSGLGAPLVVIGAVILGQNLAWPWPVMIVAAGLFSVGVSTVAVSVHNRRVNAPPDASTGGTIWTS